MKKSTTALLALSTIACLSVNANPLYTKCIACHGAQGEKVALGKSLVIKDMKKEDFIAATKGYKDGSYGREQKALMKPQVATLNDAQIEEIAHYIIK